MGVWANETCTYIRRLPTALARLLECYRRAKSAPLSASFIFLNKHAGFYSRGMSKLPHAV